MNQKGKKKVKSAKWQSRQLQALISTQTLKYILKESEPAMSELWKTKVVQWLREQWIKKKAT